MHSRYLAEVEFDRQDQAFTDGRYRRVYVGRFDGGTEIPGAASPQVVPARLTDAAGVDPEEALVYAVASCHMLWFLSIAAGQGYCVDRYVDAAHGDMDKDAQGQLAITRVVLRPRVRFSGDRIPDRETVDRMHDRAHEECFIARSIRAEIVCEAELDPG